MADLYTKTLCAGVISGMRSMAGLALVSDSLAKSQSNLLQDSKLHWVGSPKVALVMKFLAAGEIVGDKLPMTPSRIAPGPLFGRLLFGGFSSAALWISEGKRARTGALLGAVSAAAGAYTFYYLRRSAGKASGIPDPWIGLLEDILAYGVGASIIKR
jgi:uncharacterized membrane protein